MTSYRFCRTDDMSVLVDAYNRCWLPHFPDDRQFDVPEFKRGIRGLDLWCSSSMVAFAGVEPVAFLWGAKRPTETLVYRIATSPAHLRQGHARHLLTSLSSKLAILGPARLVAEVPVDRSEARALFEACGYVEEVTLVDYVLAPARATLRIDQGTPQSTVAIPVTVDDLAANGLLQEGARERCWNRDSAAIRRRREQLDGNALVTDEMIEAFVVHRPSPAGGREIVALQCLEPTNAQAHLGFLLGRILQSPDAAPLRFEKVHPEEIPAPLLEAFGFVAGRRHTRYATTARAA